MVVVCGKGLNCFTISILTGQPLKASLLSLTRQVLFLIPLLLLLPQFLPGLIGVTALQAVCFTYPLADLLSVITTGAFIIPEIVKLHRNERKDVQTEPAVA